MTRTLEELKTSNDRLTGAESMSLRTFCTSYDFTFDNLSDTYGQFLLHADLAGLSAHFGHRANATTVDHARTELYNKRWGATRIPVYNVLLMLAYAQPDTRPTLLHMSRYLLQNAGIPPDGTDLSGTSAFMYAISTKPYLDFDMAQWLLDAGTDVNRQNRYGECTAHEIVKIIPQGPAHELQDAGALGWWLERGGGLSIREGDGMTLRFLLERTRVVAPTLLRIANEHSAGHGSGSLASSGSAATGAKGKNVGRNEPCPCRGGKEFKACCGKV